MITLKFIATFPNPADIAKMADRPPELIQLVQLVHFWAQQHNVTILPPAVDAAAGRIVYEFSIPDQATWDNIVAHSNDNGIDVFDLGAQNRAFIESLGGTFERVVEGAA